MDWAEANKWTKAMLIKINAITGWIINEDTTEILIDQFRKHLRENYPDMNPDELEYAFRKYGTVVKDWGKQMNLSLIDEVLIPYKNKRLEVSQVEERIAMKEDAKQIEQKEDISDRSMEEWFKYKVREFELDPNTHLAFAPIPIYEWLDRTGRIKLSAAVKHEYLAKAVNVRQGALIESVNNNNSFDNRQALTEFNTMKENGCFRGKEIDRLKNIAKQLILKEILLDREFRL